LDFFYTITVDPGADDFTLTDFDVSLPALGPGAVEVISSPFPLTVSAGETHTDDFLVIIPDPFPGGSYGGVLTVQGNLGATLFDLPANFTVNVNGPTNTPEPDTALLLLSALGAMLLSRRFLHLRPVHISCKKA
jgi:hypothetical protein